MGDRCGHPLTTRATLTTDHNHTTRTPHSHHTLTMHSPHTHHALTIHAPRTHLTLTTHSPHTHHTLTAHYPRPRFPKPVHPFTTLFSFLTLRSRHLLPHPSLPLSHPSLPHPSLPHPSPLTSHRPSLRLPPQLRTHSCAPLSPGTRRWSGLLCRIWTWANCATETP